VVRLRLGRSRSVLWSLFCIIMAIAGVKYTVQQRNLEEDLEHPRATNAEADVRGAPKVHAPIPTTIR
jgi:hypothetical protein